MDPLITANFFKDLPALETARLRLRRFSLADLDNVFEYSSDEQVAQFTSWAAHVTPEVSRAFIQRAIDRAAEGQPSPWAIELKATTKVIGMAGLSQLEMAFFRADLFYALHRQFWGQGFAAEAARAVIDCGFKHLELNRIQAECLPENPASERVMQKVGMSFEGILREYTFFKGHFDTLKIYAILRKEWAG